MGFMETTLSGNPWDLWEPPLSKELRMQAYIWVSETALSRIFSRVNAEILHNA